MEARYVAKVLPSGQLGKRVSCSRSPLGTRHKQPTMAFQVLSAIEATVRRMFRRGENSCADTLRALIVGVNAINIHKHSVNRPRNRQPFANALVPFAAGSGTFITRRPAHNHNDILIGFHLRVPNSPIGFWYTCSFTEPDRPRKPIQRRDTVLVRQHRNDAWILISHDLSLSHRAIFGEATPERGGRAKRHFRATSKGVRVVRDTQRSLVKLWKGLPQLKGEEA